MGNKERSRKMCFYYPTPYCRFKVKDARSLVVEVSSYFANLSSTVIEPALQINIPLPVTMNRKMKKPPVKSNLRRSR